MRKSLKKNAKTLLIHTYKTQKLQKNKKFKHKHVNNQLRTENQTKKPKKLIKKIHTFKNSYEIHKKKPQKHYSFIPIIHKNSKKKIQT